MLPYQKRLWYTLNMIPRGADGGYTILETMIFLAVTAMLFIAAMTTIGGKQATVQFTQGIRDTQSKIQDVINNVSTGYFPTDSNFKCIVGDAIPANNIPNVAPSFTLGASIQGSSEKCVSLGKVLEFANSATASEGATNYNIISVAGRRINNSGQEVLSLDEAKPTAVSFAGGPDVTESSVLQFGVKVTRITVPIGTPGSLIDSGTRYGAVALFSSLPRLAGASGALASGAQRVSFAVIPASTLGETKALAVPKINNVTDITPVFPDLRQQIKFNPQNGIIICLADQSGTRKAMITLGDSGGQANAKLDIGTYNTVVCP